MEGRGIFLFKYYNINEKFGEDMNIKRKEIYKKLNLFRWVILGNKMKYVFKVVLF